jgi:exonuclease III
LDQLSCADPVERPSRQEDAENASLHPESEATYVLSDSNSFHEISEPSVPSGANVTKELTPASPVDDETPPEEDSEPKDQVKGESEDCPLNTPTGEGSPPADPDPTPASPVDDETPPEEDSEPKDQVKGESEDCPLNTPTGEGNPPASPDPAPHKPDPLPTPLAGEPEDDDVGTFKQDPSLNDPLLPPDIDRIDSDDDDTGKRTRPIPLDEVKRVLGEEDPSKPPPALQSIWKMLVEDEHCRFDFLDTGADIFCLDTCLAWIEMILSYDDAVVPTKHETNTCTYPHIVAAERITRDTPGHCGFVGLDLAKGFLQILLDRVYANRYLGWKSAGSNGGESKVVYPTRLSLGLMWAPPHFQSWTSSVFERVICMLTGRTFTKPFVDDICYRYISCLMLCLRMMQILVTAIRVGFAFSLRKTSISRRLLALGFILVSDPPGRIPDPKKVQGILDYPEPTNAATLLRFVCVANYMREYLTDVYNDAFHILGPASRNFQKYDDNCREWFHKLRQGIAEHAIGTLDPIAAEQWETSKRPAVLLHDGSATGFGAILGQANEPFGQLQPKIIRSKYVDLANAAVLEIEMRCLLWTLCEVLVGVDLVTLFIGTDHTTLRKRELLAVASNKALFRKYQRWALLIYENVARLQILRFHFDGQAMFLSDAISRGWEHLGSAYRKKTLAAEELIARSAWWKIREHFYGPPRRNDAEPNAEPFRCPEVRSFTSSHEARIGFFNHLTASQCTTLSVFDAVYELAMFIDAEADLPIDQEFLSPYGSYSSTVRTLDGHNPDDVEPTLYTTSYRAAVGDLNAHFHDLPHCTAVNVTIQGSEIWSDWAHYRSTESPWDHFTTRRTGSYYHRGKKRLLDKLPAGTLDANPIRRGPGRPPKDDKALAIPKAKTRIKKNILTPKTTRTPSTRNRVIVTTSSAKKKLVRPTKKSPKQSIGEDKHTRVLPLPTDVHLLGFRRDDARGKNVVMDLTTTDQTASHDRWWAVGRRTVDEAIDEFCKELRRLFNLPNRTCAEATKAEGHGVFRFVNLLPNDFRDRLKTSGCAFRSFVRDFSADDRYTGNNDCPKFLVLEDHQQYQIRQCVCGHSPIEQAEIAKEHDIPVFESARLKQYCQQLRDDNHDDPKHDIRTIEWESAAGADDIYPEIYSDVTNLYRSVFTNENPSVPFADMMIIHPHLDAPAFVRIEGAVKIIQFDFIAREFRIGLPHRFACVGEDFDVLANGPDKMYIILRKTPVFKRVARFEDGVFARLLDGQKNEYRAEINALEELASGTNVDTLMPHLGRKQKRAFFARLKQYRLSEEGHLQIRVVGEHLIVLPTKTTNVEGEALPLIEKIIADIHFEHDQHLQKGALHITLLRRGMWAKKLPNIISEVIARCTVCETQRAPQPLYIHPQLEMYLGPGVVLFMDFCGPYPEDKGFTHLLTFACSSTYYVWAYPTKAPGTKDVQDVLRQLFTEVKPRYLRCDNGTHFGPELEKWLAEEYKNTTIGPGRAAGYNPQGQHPVESPHKRFFKFLSGRVPFKPPYGITWVDEIAPMLSSYRDTPIPATGGCAPAEMWRGALVDQSQRTGVHTHRVEDTALEQLSRGICQTRLRRLQTTDHRVIAHLETIRRRGLVHGTREPTFKEGDYVIRELPDPLKRMKRMFAGYFEMNIYVIEHLGEFAARLRRIDGRPTRIASTPLRRLRKIHLTAENLAAALTQCKDEPDLRVRPEPIKQRKKREAKHRSNVEEWDDLDDDDDLPGDAAYGVIQKAQSAQRRKELPRIIRKEMSWVVKRRLPNISLTRAFGGPGFRRKVKALITDRRGRLHREDYYRFLKERQYVPNSRRVDDRARYHVLKDRSNDFAPSLQKLVEPRARPVVEDLENAPPDYFLKDLPPANWQDVIDTLGFPAPALGGGGHHSKRRQRRSSFYNGTFTKATAMHRRDILATLRQSSPGRRAARLRDQDALKNVDDAYHEILRELPDFGEYRQVYALLTPTGTGGPDMYIFYNPDSLNHFVHERQHDFQQLLDQSPTALLFAEIKLSPNTEAKVRETLRQIAPGYRLEVNRGPNGRAGTASLIRNDSDAVVTPLGSMPEGRGQLVSFTSYDLINVYGFFRARNPERQAQLKEWDTTLDECLVQRGTRPYILLGDLNIDPDIESDKLKVPGTFQQDRDALDQLVQKHHLVDLNITRTKTCMWIVGPQRGFQMRFDHAYATPDLCDRILGFRVLRNIRRACGDHHPLMVTVSGVQHIDADLRPTLPILPIQEATSGDQPTGYPPVANPSSTPPEGLLSTDVPDSGYSLNQLDQDTTEPVSLVEKETSSQAPSEQDPDSRERILCAPGVTQFEYDITLTDDWPSDYTQFVLHFRIGTVLLGLNIPMTLSTAMAVVHEGANVWKSIPFLVCNPTKNTREILCEPVMRDLNGRNETYHVQLRRVNTTLISGYHGQITSIVVENMGLLRDTHDTLTDRFYRLEAASPHASDDAAQTNSTACTREQITHAPFCEEEPSYLFSVSAFQESLRTEAEATFPNICSPRSDQEGLFYSIGDEEKIGTADEIEECIKTRRLMWKQQEDGTEVEQDTRWKESLARTGLRLCQESDISDIWARVFVCVLVGLRKGMWQEGRKFPSIHGHRAQHGLKANATWTTGAAYPLTCLEHICMLFLLEEHAKDDCIIEHDPRIHEIPHHLSPIFLAKRKNDACGRIVVDSRKYNNNCVPAVWMVTTANDVWQDLLDSVRIRIKVEDFKVKLIY